MAAMHGTAAAGNVGSMTTVGRFRHFATFKSHRYFSACSEECI